MRAVRIRMAGGDRYSILLGSDGMPLPYPNLFLTVHYRNSSKASNTCHVVLEQLRYLCEVLDFLDIDLVARCLRGAFLKIDELESIVKWAGYTVKDFREHASKIKRKQISNLKDTVKRIEVARAVIVVESESGVCNETAYNRLTTFAEYIEWLERKLYPTKESKSGFFLKSIRNKRYPSYDDELVEEYKSFTTEQMEKILDIVRPESPINPWKNVAVKYRNQLIVNILKATGCRRGELLRIKVEDIKQRSGSDGGKILIRNREDNDDYRLARPEAKTKGRYVPIVRGLAAMCDNYIVEHRGDTPGIRSNPYLFITHKARGRNSALSLAAINKIFRDLTSAVGFNVHPHAFRHYWNDRFSEKADELIAINRVSESKSESDRQKLMGWSVNSKMAKYYSKRHEDKRALEFGIKLQK